MADTSSVSLRSSAGEQPAEGRGGPRRASAWAGWLRRDLLGYVLVGLPVVVVLVLLVVPTIYTGWVSLHSWSMVSGESPGWIGLKNYQSIIGNSSLRDSVVRTALFVALTVSVQFVIGFGAAMLLHNMFGKLKLLRTVLLLPLMVSDVVVGLSWRLILQYNGGLLNWALGLVGIEPVSWLGQDLALYSVVVADSWQNVPFVTLIIYAALQTLPDDVMDAAYVDGATGWTRLRHVIIPIIKPAILVVLLFRTIFAIRTFGSVWILTEGGPGRASTLISIDAFKLAFRDYDLGLGAAMSFCLLVIGLVVTILYMKWLSRDSI